MCHKRGGSESTVNLTQACSISVLQFCVFKASKSVTAFNFGFMKTSFFTLVFCHLSSKKEKQ